MKKHKARKEKEGGKGTIEAVVSKELEEERKVSKQEQEEKLERRCFWHGIH